MCTKIGNGCMPSSMKNNVSFLSDEYNCKPINNNNNKNNSNKSFTQMKIFFKNKFKLCTGIDTNTTFNDLKLAVLVSSYKAKYSNKKHKLVKNYEHLKKKAQNNYVICESVNSVEKIIDSENKVIHELNRINSEAIFLTGIKVIHIMRDKNHLMPMPPLSTEFPLSPPVDNCNESEKVPILREFFTEEAHRVPKLPTRKDLQKSATNAIIDEQLERFDQFIEQRKAYIQLLEQYLDLVESIEIEKLPVVSRLETFV